MLRRKHLARIEQTLVVERAFHALLLGQIDFVEHLRHQVALLDSDAVLAGEHAADFDAELENVGAESLGALELARGIGVVKDQRMQIAVAGVEHVGDPQTVARRHFPHPRQHQRQLAARNGAVHAIVVRRDAPHRRKRRLAPGPERQPLLFGIGHPQIGRAAALGSEARPHFLELFRSGSGEPCGPPAASRCCARKLATRSFPRRPPRMRGASHC